jgi:ABC-type polysaccharide/polyol phosphate transport system ATPase subunit
MLTGYKATSSTGEQTTSAVAINLEDISVRFRLPVERVSTVKEYAIRWLQRRLEYRDLWALRRVTFSVGRGEIFGVVGANGAGKTTLLKVIARVLHPTEGRVRVSGSVAPILELGGGFHPELTGRENVYLYGSLLGWTRRALDEGFGDIVDFAELWDFIDAPLRTYSSGMTVRLAFAVATAKYADVILVDEVLAVGDIQFQEKCLARIEQYREAGSTIVVVSHNPELITRMCTRSVWLSSGEVKELGPSGNVIGMYTTD